MDNSFLRLGAVWLSRIFHPFIISVFVLFLIQILSGYPAMASAGWTVLSFALVILPILIFLLLRVRAGRYEDIDVSIREDRYVFYFFGASCFVLLLVLLFTVQAPPIVQRSLQAALLALMAGAVMNRLVNKLSLHALTMAGSSTILFFVSPIAGIVLGLIGLFVGWSRVHLTRHTSAEVIWGWILGVVIFALWLYISAGFYPTP